MSVASPIPCIKLKISHPSSKIYPNPSFIVRGSKAEGPLRRPSAPSLSPPPPLLKPAAPSQPQPQVQSQSPAKVEAGVTFEYQRKMAKEMQDYFKQKKLEEVDQGPFFGFLGKNEIANGRWAMFGFAVGLLTEYATGADFVQQLKILLSNFGIVDLD
ncbi:uncharacterized protein A4U43_C01F22170 [Asparagus officinalis]|uniref:Light-harvesting complex-like protein OHP2, chloroplastic n=1 Tax=Asparagus officinalis TaxID=4686 RepID=A0A5P1FT23_ASPOF|nr:light-harvesting complex-like protein OHP2, chloroplastic isoform X1 [Asparagus officinalis]ONK80823.1 uncharacterized protein A4U43_C01F22170 [Asparagus officinalis]